MVGVVQQRPNQLAAGECVLVNKTFTGHGWTDFFHDVTCQTRSNCEPTMKMARFMWTERRELLLTLAQRVKRDNPEFLVESDERNWGIEPLGH